MKKVLIVDDAAFMRMSIKMTIEKHGFEVVGEAENGKVALEKYLELRPDIVTMDITMPEMSGNWRLKGNYEGRSKCYCNNGFCNGTRITC